MEYWRALSARLLMLDEIIHARTFRGKALCGASDGVVPDDLDPKPTTCESCKAQIRKAWEELFIPSKGEALD